MSSYTASSTATAGNATSSVSSATAGGAAPAAGGGAPPGVDEETLIYHICILVLGLIALLFLLRIPRIVARLARREAWSQGHFLRNVAFHGSPRIVHLTHDKVPSSGMSSDESHTYYQHATHIQRLDEKGGQMVLNYPPHVSTCPSFLRGLSSELSTRILPGYSLSQVICGLVYLGCWIYPTLYKSNPFSDPERTGWVAIGQLPFVFAFASKNNALGPFLGLGYEKLNFMHRIAGMIMVVAVNVHGMGYIYKWLINEVFSEQIAVPSNYWGLIGLIACDILYFFSTEFWRKKAYNVFLGSHIGGFSLLLVGAWHHKEENAPFCWAAAALYSFDILLRWIKTRVHTAIARPLPELGMTRLEIPNINAGWRAGQHVRLRVLSTGMGLFGWAEVHPFTIASASDGPEGMILMVKKVGGWTNKLFDISRSGGYTEAGVGRNVAVMVEGPYGGPGHAIPSSNSAAVFVVGGSGITYALAGMNELIQKDLRGESRVKMIELIWTVQDPAALVPLVPTFSAMIQQSLYTPDFFHPRLSLSPGRPKLSTMFEATISRAVTSGAGPESGMMIAVCGPTALADDVVKQVSQIDPKRRDEMGGIEIHEDVFGW
ncbi:hypothetical protein BDZ89DRAFT_1125231 [Hymenopellis radicata]|nr:hypothetical protein BDZ89DRAFT_1125231 [Hymenopellis radicata]